MEALTLEPWQAVLLLWGAMFLFAPVLVAAVAVTEGLLAPSGHRARAVCQYASKSLRLTRRVSAIWLLCGPGFVLLPLGRYWSILYFLGVLAVGFSVTLARDAAAKREQARSPETSSEA